MDHIPWVEKYRPDHFDDIVLSKTNRKILKNIIETNNFPNLLLYGPPGTGKTTTIINLIDEYQKTYKQKRKGLKIHLNASDDRGIDIIRNHINQFVNTSTLFGKGMKFIILDEVDYMTKNAQHALRYLIQQYNPNIRFCLICNYISRIDVALQNEFIRLGFCNLPSKDISIFLDKIIKSEKISITEKQIECIKNSFDSDIRSMINFIQSNHQNINIEYKITTHAFWEEMLTIIKSEKIEKIIQIIDLKCSKYNIEKNNFIKEFIIFLIKNKTELINTDMLSMLTYIIHNIHTNIKYLSYYFISELRRRISCE